METQRNIGVAAILTRQELADAKAKCSKDPEEGLRMARVAMMMFADRLGHAEIGEAWLGVQESALMAQLSKQPKISLRVPGKIKNA